MATYEGVCKLTNKKEIILVDMISARTQSNPNGATVGMIQDCTVHIRTGINLCENCNLYEEIQYDVKTN